MESWKAEIGQLIVPIFFSVRLVQLLMVLSYPGLCQNDVDCAGTYLARDICIEG